MGSMAAIVVNRPRTADEFLQTITKSLPSSHKQQSADSIVAVNELNAKYGTGRNANPPYGNRDKWQPSRQSPNQHASISSRKTKPMGKGGLMMKCALCTSEEQLHAKCPTLKDAKRYADSSGLQLARSSDEEKV